MAFSVQNNKYSHGLFMKADQCVLGIPGENIAKKVLFCGVESGRQLDKVKACDFTLIESATVRVPGIRECIANVELQIIKKVIIGDHLSIFGEATRYAVDPSNRERCLLSVGPDHDGYEVLAAKGIHRIGVVSLAHK